MHNLRKGLALTIILVSLVVFCAPFSSVSRQTPHIKRFRILGIECTFDSYRMKSAQRLIETLWEYPNWHNTSEYQACISLLSLYSYDELNDTLKPFYKGLPTKETIQNETINFLGQAEPGEIVIFYYCGHGENKVLADPGINYEELITWLNSGGLPQANVVVILDTCHSGSWVADGEGGVLGPNRVVLAACTAEQYAWGGPEESGVFTFFINEGASNANDTDSDGWISTAELFDYAKPKTTELLEGFANQTPVCYYGMMEGDIPIIQRDITKSFPERNIAVLGMNVSSTYVTAGTIVQIEYLVKNYGNKKGVFNFFLHFNLTYLIGKQIGLLAENESRILVFNWDTTSFCNGTYVLDVFAGITPCESDVSDNLYVYGAVYVQQKGLLLVPDQYLTIQEAINKASPNDIVKVRLGTYQENVVLNKTLVLAGENPNTTIIDGGLTSFGINVLASGVTISNFTVQNSTYGLLLVNTSNNIIYDNILASNVYGIYMQQSSNNKLRNTSLLNNHYGIGIRGTEITHFVNDIDSSNTVDGKPVCYWVNKHGEDVPLNAGFVALVNSSDIKIRNADLHNNYDGVLLVNSNNTVIENCNITNNYYGVSFIFSTENTVTYCTIENSTYAVMACFSSNCVLYCNNFINNTNAILSYATALQWSKDQCGNFWSDYFGEDLNLDGIGDFPHLIGFGQDDYPLMGLAKRLDAGIWDEKTYYVSIVSNFAVEDFAFNSNTMSVALNISNPLDGQRFCRVCIPKALLDCPEGIDSWIVWCDEVNISSQCNKWQNSTHTFIYVPCTSNLHTIKIIGTKAILEFPSITILLSMLICATLVMLAFRKYVDTSKVL